MTRMKLAVSALTLAAFTVAAEDFTGEFTGAYFSGWTTFINDNQVVTEPSSLDLQSYSLTLRGATSASPDPTGTPSIIEFTHPIVGTAPTLVNFSSLFYAEVAAHTNDSAAFIVNGAVRQNLTTTTSDSQQHSFTLNPGDVFGFRLTSDNDNIADVLQVTAVPEPSVIAMAALGGLLLTFVVSRRRG